MNYDEFKLFVKENVGAYFDTEEQVKDVVIKEIHKNGISLDGLLVTPANVNISPVIYLNNYYVRNMTEHEALEALKNIAKHIKQNIPDSTVSPEERLSDHAYKYDYAAHEIYRADQEQMRLEEQIANQSMRPRISR